MTGIDANPNKIFADIMEQIGDGVPGAAHYQQLSALVLDLPEAIPLQRIDPFSPEYKTAAMQLYLALRGRPEQGYDVRRDEQAGTELPENLWTGLIPWSFRDAQMVSEHLFAWGHIFSHLKLQPGGAVLEYGPGSGQILLSLARMGYRACGADIDAVALEAIRAQAAHLGLPVELERAEFGAGFADETFDAILFYEAFHHAFDFEALLTLLHRRLKPGGRVVLCGEPVVQAPFAAVPYPWGPRLDALSVFCIRRFGWMELGFSHDYFMEIARRTGWAPQFHPFPNCGRAAVYVLEDAAEAPPLEAASRPDRAPVGATPPGSDDPRVTIATLRREIEAIHHSTSWRLTAPIRAVRTWLTR